MDSNSYPLTGQIQDPMVSSASPLLECQHQVSIPAISIPTLPDYRSVKDSQVIQGELKSSAKGGLQKQPPATRATIGHPYARLIAKKEEVKRRKVWNHVLEKHIFTPYELSTLGAPHRRAIYLTSLEAHIDELHTQLIGLGYWPVAFDQLERYKGLNSKTAKSMVAGRQHEATLARLKILELQRANENLEKELLRLQYRNGSKIVH
ncbi:hypothetical protein L218DRAFT_952445 [Marasmius fiardii PR-910]|nr:hypothetical protein L218DRAFT_952445 [Marasmius fiardii PR-910]